MIAQDGQARRYQVKRPLASLFHADLFLAQWSGPAGFSKPFTLWRVQPELCEHAEDTHELLSDLRCAATLSVSPVTQVLDVWSTESGIEIAVEHVSGVSLAEVLRLTKQAAGTLELQQVLAIALELAWALEMAHAEGLVHGDLCTDRVTLGFDGSVKLTGFGFGKLLPRLSPDGLWATWHHRCYQPRERLTGSPLEPSADIFSLGAMLLELCTGTAPYGSRRPDTLLQLARSGASPIPVGQAVPQELAGVLEQACATDAEMRYREVSTMAEDLHRLLLRLAPRRSTAAQVRATLTALNLLTSPVAQGRKEPEEQRTSYEVSIPSAVSRSAGRPDEDQTPVEHNRSPRTRAVSAGAPAERARMAPAAGTRWLEGRDDALAAVGRALDSAAGGTGQALLVRAASGMGRSRLLAELQQRLRHGGGEPSWVQVQARQGERAVRYAGWFRLLGAIVGLPADHALDDLARAADNLRSFGVDASMLEAIGGLLGERPPLPPDRTRGLLIDAVIRCLSALSWERLTVVAWDDLQWCDPASHSCWVEVLDQVPYMPVVALMTAREGDQPTWGFTVPEELTLPPLSEEQGASMVRGLVPQASRLEPGLGQAITRRAGGNPVLVETVVQMMLDGDLLVVRDGQLTLKGASEVPPLDRVVAGVLDRLGQAAQHIGLAAALAGPAFSHPLIALATDSPTADVSAALDDLIRRHGLLRRGPEGVVFRHRRLREAVVQRFPAGEVEALGARIAHIALTESDSPPCAVVDHAADLLAGAGELMTASEILLDAAASQELGGDYEGAADRLWRAHKLADASGEQDPADRLDLLLRVGRAALNCLSMEHGQEALELAIPLADAAQDPRLAADARLLLSRLYTRGARVKDALRTAREALPLAEQVEDQGLRARAYSVIAECHQQTGEFGPDLKYIEEAMRLAHAQNDAAALGQCLQLAVMHAAGVGQVSTTWKYLNWARAHAQVTRDTVLMCQLARAEGLLHLFTGNMEQALRANLRGLELAREHSLQEYEIILLHNVADVHLHMDNIREATYYFTESSRRSRAARFDRLHEANEMFLGFVELSCFQSEAGLARMETAIARSEEQGRLWNLAQGLQLLGRAHLQLGRTEQAVEALQRAVDLSRRSGVTFFIKEAGRWLERATGGAR